jgi:hypothetical protein
MEPQRVVRALFGVCRKNVIPAKSDSLHQALLLDLFIQTSRELAYSAPIPQNTRNPLAVSEWTLVYRAIPSAFRRDPDRFLVMHVSGIGNLIFWGFLTTSSYGFPAASI